MLFLQFKTLPLPQQADLLCRRGVQLAERRSGDYLLALYALFDFYVEVHYRYLDSEVILVSSFYNAAFLEPYLADVRIEDLLHPLGLTANQTGENLSC